jgi:hypothetical protein
MAFIDETQEQTVKCLENHLNYEGYSQNSEGEIEFFGVKEAKSGLLTISKGFYYNSDGSWYIRANIKVEESLVGDLDIAITSALSEFNSLYMKEVSRHDNTDHTPNIKYYFRNELGMFTDTDFGDFSNGIGFVDCMKEVRELSKLGKVSTVRENYHKMIELLQNKYSNIK